MTPEPLYLMTIIKAAYGYNRTEKNIRYDFTDTPVDEPVFAEHRY